MNTKHLTLILALATASILNLSSLNAAEPGCSPTAKACHPTTVAISTADPSPVSPKSAVVASPKTFANFPYLAGSNKTQPAKAMGACACCKP